MTDFKILEADASPQSKQTNNKNLDVNNFCIMLYSEPLSMHKERPGLHTCALWEIRPQLALVESFPLHLYIIRCYWLHFNLAALVSSNLLSILSSSFLMSLVSSSDKLTWSKDFSGHIPIVPGFKNSVQHPNSANILLRPCVPSSDASEPAFYQRQQVLMTPWHSQFLF